MDFSPLWISLKVAVCATVFTFFFRPVFCQAGHLLKIGQGTD